jgi:hypothetical protein
MALDPLRRVFVPIEDKRGFFRTHDYAVYQRNAESGVIRRAIPKQRGKAARRAERQARRQEKSR